MCMNEMDYEPAEFLREELRRNRKPWRLCRECGREIGTGEVYEVVSGRWDGYFSTHATCAHCLKAREWLSESMGWSSRTSQSIAGRPWRRSHGRALWLACGGDGLGRTAP